MVNEIVLNNGITFKYAFDILDKKLQSASQQLLQGSQETALDAALFIPAVVNGSFACELFIKSMLSNNSARSHKLDILFGNLDLDIRNKIKDNTVQKMREIFSFYDDAAFQQDLIDNNNIFETWRYFHEGHTHSANLTFIKKFMEVILMVANDERNYS